MPHTIVIFGASGDLTSRKLVPALYNLMRTGALPEQTRIIGFSRTPMSDEEWRVSLRATTAKHCDCGPLDDESWERFAATIHYQPGDIGVSADIGPKARYTPSAPRVLRPWAAAVSETRPSRPPRPRPSRA